jgi:hypothetical protein
MAEVGVTQFLKVTRLGPGAARISCPECGAVGIVSESVPGPRTLLTIAHKDGCEKAIIRPDEVQ